MQMIVLSLNFVVFMSTQGLEMLIAPVLEVMVYVVVLLGVTENRELLVVAMEDHDMQQSMSCWLRRAASS